MYCKTLISLQGTKYFRGPCYSLAFALLLWQVPVSLYARRANMVLWLRHGSWIISHFASDDCETWSKSVPRLTNYKE